MDARTNRNAAAATAPGLPLLVVGLAVVWLTMLLLGGRGVDHEILLASHLGERPWVLIALFITRLGDWEILLGASFFGAAWLLYRRQWRLALFLLGATLIGRLLVALQKALLGRVRPESDLPLVDVDSLAFPSGHAANALIVYLMLALLLARAGAARTRAVAAALALALLIGASRVPLGVHWPSDVIAGWAFGGLWVLLCLRFAQTLKRNSSTSPS